MIGSPPGYVGYEEAGQLTEKVRRRPYSVVLFDEIEKAHPDVMNILLQILDEGKINDAQGRTVDFSNTVICMTSNAGSSDQTTASLGFNRSEEERNEEKSRKALSQFLRPEFLGRVDEVITFKPLSEETLQGIAALMLDEYKPSMEAKGIAYSYTPAALAALVHKSQGGKFGARDLRRTIRKAVEDPAAEKIIVMIGLYAGLRREEILGLKWDCVFLDEKTPYISVRRAWHVEGGEPVVNTLLKTPAAKRDVPIPKCLVACLKEEREKAESEYVISNSKGTVLTETQFVRVWKYITVRSTAERCYYTYVNGQSIKHRIKPRLGEHQPNNPKLVYTMDFKVTPHMLRHTYITNLIYKGVDPKTVQYLAGHENSKTTMDIYAKVKYNKPEELSSVVNAAFGLR